MNQVEVPVKMLPAAFYFITLLLITVMETARVPLCVYE